MSLNTGEEAALKAEQVSITFQDRKKRLPVLQDISLAVGQGEFVSLLGPSGSGKSTLFHLIGGLLTPAQGRIYMNGEDVTGMRGRISYMPQQPALFPWLTTLDNVLLGQENAPGSGTGPRREARTEARHWLDEVGLGKFADAYPHMLSGGMQQRAAFLRAMLSPQELMLLDEPFSALDELTRSDMQQWLLHMWERNRRSVLFITHSIEEALLLSDRIYVLSARPASILQVVDVPFARPRREEITTDKEFVELKRELSRWMREEKAKKSAVWGGDSA
ncbi:ABC transporter ATP-binding protein [Paenibacillus sp. P96]|uniref:ABC transporter ATP-binding protein n=1 Tax=Paenibacillus zeirhizosphaerae TaxID=2987519 RepID=A0ABT9FNE2_9BACL|nr:ABC transporter ATP-binding protein [Paenibacillus sp. P96]MDP4096026.1 ABC transporter ATP-binding protein [Paenibacillus sp. P96]